MEGINGVIVEDKAKNVFFAYVNKFPEVCAQADTAESAISKVNIYFQAYMEKIKNTDIQIGETKVFCGV